MCEGGGGGGGGGYPLVIFQGGGSIQEEGVKFSGGGQDRYYGYAERNSLRYMY